MAPLALAFAEAPGASPYPFAMTVALAASTSFMTPVSSLINVLEVGAGKYSFGNFVRVGTPFALGTIIKVDNVNSLVGADGRWEDIALIMLPANPEVQQVLVLGIGEKVIDGGF